MSRADEIAGGLAADNSDARLKSLKAIKNSVIGSKREKTKHLLYLPIILEILSTDQQADVLIQAAQAIGSFAAAPDGANAVIDQGGVPKLLIALNHPDVRVAEASARALKLLYTKTTDISPKEVHHVLQTPGATTTLVLMLSSPTSLSIGESAAWIIAKCCEIDEKDAKPAFCNAGALQPLVQLLQDGSQRNRQAAALSAVTALTHNDLITARKVLMHHSVVFNLLACVKSSTEDPRMRFTACVCLTNLAPALESRRGSGGGGGGSGNSGSSGSASILPTREDVQETVLPVLVRLMREDSPEHPLHHHHLDKNNNAKQNIKNNSILVSRLPLPAAAPPVLSTAKTSITAKNSVSAEVPGVLLHLLANKPSLQAAAVDADAILRLATLLKSPTTCSNGKINSLLVLGMLTETTESHRRKLVECGALPAVAAALSDPLLAVRGAACCCMKSLSRSTRLLRCSLGSLSNIATPLLELSRNEDDNISTVAAATLANMAIEYSSIKEQVLVLQGIQRFVELTEAKDNKKLQLYGIWGLSSAVYLSSEEVKMAVMKALLWTRVVEFLHGEDQDVKEKTLLLLRNLAHRGGGSGTSGGVNSSSPAPTTVLEWSQGQFLPSILHTLKTILEQGSSSDSPGQSVHGVKQFEHALYCIVNIASGHCADKDAVLGLVVADLRPSFYAALSHREESIREAAVWVIINLTYVQDSSTGGDGEQHELHRLEERRQELMALGIADDLRAMMNADTSMRVRERADTAWVQLLGGRRITVEEEPHGGGAGRASGGAGRVTLVSDEDVVIGGRRVPRSVLFNAEQLLLADEMEEDEEEEEDFMDEEGDGDDGDGNILPW